ncbi:MAG: hypothetical protein AAF682_28225 [Planctomycetota bacterium]
MKTTLVTALLTSTLLAGAAGAQCFVPDGLSGPCWEPTDANLPDFPGAQLPGLNICWDACDPTAETCLQVNIDNPMQVSCDQYIAELITFDCAGMPLLTGKVTLDYTRTWQEIGASPNIQYQVWRFVAKVDLAQVIAGIDPGCPIPNSLGTYETAFYYGYMDFARNCFTGEWEHSLVLFHNCDAFQHQPGISSKPGVFDPGTTYAIVAPSTSANPFVPAAMPAPGGSMVAEAVRLSADPAIGGCVNEERISQGVIQPIGQGCMCPFALFPGQVTARHIEGIGSCPTPIGPGSSFRSLNVFPGFPWLENVTTSIGSWTTTSSYPGPEAAWVDEGVYLYDDSCATAAGTPSLFADLLYGASTSKGFEILFDSTFGAPLTENFTDLASNVSFPVGTPLPLPLVGDVKPTRHLIYTNI